MTEGDQYLGESNRLRRGGAGRGGAGIGGWVPDVASRGERRVPNFLNILYMCASRLVSKPTSKYVYLIINCLKGIPLSVT